MPLDAMREQKHHCCCCFTGIFSTLLGVILVAVGISLILNYGISSEVLPPQWQSTEGKKILGIILVCCGCGFLIIGILVGALYFAVCSKSQTEPSGAVPTQVISHDSKRKGSNGGKSRRSSPALRMTKMPAPQSNQFMARQNSLGSVSPTTSTTSSSSSRNGALPKISHVNELNGAIRLPPPMTTGHRRHAGKNKHDRKHKKVLQTMPEECEEIEMANRSAHTLHPSIHIFSSEEYLCDSKKSEPLTGIENPALTSDDGSSVVTSGTVTPPSTELLGECYTISSLAVAPVDPVTRAEKEELAKDIADILR